MKRVETLKGNDPYAPAGEDARDAARYRWLRANAVYGRMGGEDFSLNCDEPESEWDAAIDAALSATGTG